MERQVQEGCDDAAASGLASVFEEHRAALVRFLAARCGSSEDAQDLLQELWIKIRTQPSGPIANARSYLFRMANNLALDRARGRQRTMQRERRWLDCEYEFSSLPEDRMDPADSAEETIARDQEARILHEAIAELPDGAARALRLYRFEELGQADIAQIMGISRSGVEKHLALAMKRLRAALFNCGSFASVTSEEQGIERGRRPQKEQGQ